MKNIVTTYWLNKNLNDENLAIVDCRFDLSKPAAGREAYNHLHIPGAIYLDLESDLSSDIKEHGGRHPLPDIEEFLSTIGKSGIDENTTVVAYDDGSYAMAARFWWLLKFIGHRNVYVLDGGFKEWESKGFPVSKDQPSVSKKKYIPSIRNDLKVDIHEVKRAIKDDSAYLVDARAPERYAGEIEPIDPVAGHIPTALNFFFQRNIKDDKWKSIDELKENFKEITDKKVISYCGSGVTACVNVLAMDEVGITSKLYVGSWSDWSSYKDNLVEK